MSRDAGSLLLKAEEKVVHLVVSALDIVIDPQVPHETVVYRDRHQTVVDVSGVMDLLGAKVNGF